MYLFYIDESGTRDPDVGTARLGGLAKDWLYVLTAIGIFEHRWKDFYRAIVGRKRDLLARIKAEHGTELELNSTEIKSNWIRIAYERARHPFLSRLTAVEIRELVDVYYEQLDDLRAPVISVVVDKRLLRPPVDAAWLHAKAWELLCERVQLFMSHEYPEHTALMVADDMGRRPNCGLAMQHARFLETGTAGGSYLQHVIELPLFVRSELSEGVQLADLCGYSTYRAFRDENLAYSYFQPVFQRLYRRGVEGHIDGLKIFPSASPLLSLIEAIPDEKGRSIVRSDLPLLN